MAAADSGGPLSISERLRGGGVKEGGIAADEAEDEGGKKRDSPCGRSIPGICPDSYEFPTDPAILSRPPPCTSTVASNRGGWQQGLDYVRWIFSPRHVVEWKCSLLLFFFFFSFFWKGRSSFDRVSNRIFSFLFSSSFSLVWKNLGI